MLPDLEHLEAHLATLERIAQGYREDTPEQAALLAAAHALLYVQHTQTCANLRAWVESWNQPPTALQVLHAKLAGIEDLPHELGDETLREVERLMEELRQLRH